MENDDARRAARRSSVKNLLWHNDDIDGSSRCEEVFFSSLATFICLCLTRSLARDKQKKINDTIENVQHYNALLADQTLGLWQKFADKH